MRKSTARSEPPMARGSAGGPGSTVLRTPPVTSSGLFHQQQQPSRSSGRAVMMPPAPGPSAIRKIEDDGDEHDNALLELHTSAAKDGVIEMLTAKASKLGISLDRTMLAKKDVEDRADKIQALLEGETSKRKDVEHGLHRQQAEAEASAQEKKSMKWEIDSLRGRLGDVEERSKAWVQEETERRRAAEEALAREKALAIEYVEGVYPEGDGPVIGKDGGAAAEFLVRELVALGEALRKRDADLNMSTERLDDAVDNLKTERERREAVQEQLEFTQDRLEAAKRKGRQLSAHLEVESGDNEILRAQARALEQENEMRTKALQDRKAKAQQRQRGDTRDMMAESKAKDDRIKKLESKLMQERARLESDLQSARSDYEEAAKESRRKTARLQRRCLELEYLAASKQSKASDEKGGGESSGSGGGGGGGGGPLTVVSPSGRRQTTRGAGLRSGGSSSSRGDGETRQSSTSSFASTPNVVAGLVSTASMLPWRRGSASTSEASSSSGVRAGAGGGGAAAAATDSMHRPGRRSADRLPDPSRHNESAPAWMRADLAVDRVQAG